MSNFCQNTKHAVRSNVFAAGGRYDKLIDRLKKPFSFNPNMSQHNISAVGVSIAFDAITGVVSPLKTCQYDVLVCSVGRKLMLKEKLKMAQALWAINIKTDFIQEPVTTLEDLQVSRCYVYFL